MVLQSMEFQNADWLELPQALSSGTKTCKIRNSQIYENISLEFWILTLVRRIIRRCAIILSKSGTSSDYIYIFFLINKYFIKKRKRIQWDLQSWKKRKLKQNKYQAFLLQNGQKLNEKLQPLKNRLQKRKLKLRNQLLLPRKSSGVSLSP